MPTEEEVLRAIHDAAAASGDRHAELRHDEIAERIGCRPDDADFQTYLARAATTGLIETLDEVDQLEGPTRFRLTD